MLSQRRRLSKLWRKSRDSCRITPGNWRLRCVRIGKPLVLVSLAIGVPSLMANTKWRARCISTPTTRPSLVRNISWRDTVPTATGASTSTGNCSADPNSETSPPRSTLKRNYTSLPSWSSFPRMRLFWPDSRNFMRGSARRSGLLLKPYRRRGWIKIQLINNKRIDFPFLRPLLPKIILLSNLILIVLPPSMPSLRILISSWLREKNEENYIYFNFACPSFFGLILIIILFRIIPLWLLQEFSIYN